MFNLLAWSLHSNGVLCKPRLVYLYSLDYGSHLTIRNVGQ